MPSSQTSASKTFMLPYFSSYYSQTSSSHTSLQKQPQNSIQLSQLHTEDTDFPTTLSPYSKHIPLFPMVFSQEGLHCNTFFIRTDIRLYQIWANYVSYTLLYYRVKNPTQQPGNKIIISFTNCWHIEVNNLNINQKGLQEHLM